MKVGRILLLSGIGAGVLTAGYFIVKKRREAQRSKVINPIAVLNRDTLANRAPSSKTLTALFANKKI